MAFRPSKSIPIGSASGSENVDHVWPTTKRFVWRNAWRNLIARPAPAKSLSMNGRIVPRCTRHAQLRAQAARRRRVDRARLVSRSRHTYRDRGRDESIVGAEGAQRVNGDHPRLAAELEGRLGARNADRSWKISSRTDGGRQIRARVPRRCESSAGWLLGVGICGRSRRRCGRACVRGFAASTCCCSASTSDPAPR